LGKQLRYILRSGDVVEHQQPAVMAGQPAMHRRHDRRLRLGTLGQVEGTGEGGEVT
jgi:hypothetical protein